MMNQVIAKYMARAVTCACLLVATVPLVGVTATEAAAETRSLKLHYVHTKETATITFKRNGRYDQKGLQELNRFLRDWRRNQPTKMDPRLFDLVWEVYRRTGATGTIHVVSAFRAPETNNMLRSRSKGVAKKSQHTLGKAMDFYIPGVKLSRLREVAMQLQVGGVGFYPTSGSPFVHLDVGSVRAWPRMSRQELVRIFPKGNTIHLPSDGKPLPGYEQAMADYKRRVSSSSVQVASTAGAGPASSGSTGKRRTLLQAIFGGGDEDEDAEAIAAPVPAAQPRRQNARPEAPAPVAVEEPVAIAALQPQRQEIVAPLPASRPAFQSGNPTGLATALYSTNRNPAEEAMRAATTPMPEAAPAPTSEFADLAAVSVPVPTLLGARNVDEQSVETAALGDASIPVPVTRPVVAENLLQTAALEEDVDKLVEQDATLSPQVVAALSQSASSARDGIVKPQEVAMPIPESAVNHRVSVQPSNQVAAVQQNFGDSFDVPPVVADRLSAGLPAKGSRPSKRDADVAYQASVSGGQLTQNSISDWALSQNKGVSLRTVKAPRVVNRLLSQDVASSNTGNSFQQGARAVDSSRFSTPVKLN